MKQKITFIHSPISLDLRRRLRAEAALRGKPMADLITEALERYLEAPLTCEDSGTNDAVLVPESGN